MRYISLLIIILHIIIVSHSSVDHITKQYITIHTYITIVIIIIIRVLWDDEMICDDVYVIMMRWLLIWFDLLLTLLNWSWEKFSFWI